MRGACSYVGWRGLYRERVGGRASPFAGYIIYGESIPQRESDFQSHEK